MELAPDEVRVSLMPDRADSPARYRVWRAGECVGRLIDWTDYPEPPATPGMRVFGIERPAGDSWTEEDAAWDDKLEALAALLGEPVERGIK